MEKIIFCKKINFFTRGLFVACLYLSTFNLNAQETVRKISDEKGDRAPLVLLTEQLQINNGGELKSIKNTTDRRGMIHEKFQYHFNGYKVEGMVATTHSINGKVKTISSNYEKINPSNVQLNVSESIAELTARQAVDFTTPITSVEKDIVITNLGEGITWRLAHKINIQAESFKEASSVYIDASNGEVLQIVPKFITEALKRNDSKSTMKKIDESHINLIAKFEEGFVPATGTAQTAYSGTQSITTDLRSGIYYLEDFSRTSNGVGTYDLSTYHLNGNIYYYTDDNNSWTSAEFNNADGDIYALDAHFGTLESYDYFLEEHGRDSYDGQGGSVDVFVNDYNSFSAGWGSGTMIIGDGTLSYDPLSCLDIVAHEFAHGVTATTSGLIYEREYGAINESLSDIWALNIEFHLNNELGLNKNLDLLGLETGNPVRSFANPNLGNQPDTYRGANWYPATVAEGCNTPIGNVNDYCGVHINSGVGNFWYWNLVFGGSGTNDNGDTYSVTGIGIDKGEDIVYLSLDYLTPTSEYVDWREATIQAAKDIHGEGSQEEISVTNGWYAVGVGDAYNGNTSDTEAPSRPNNLLASNISETGFDVSWNASSDNVGVTGYDVYLDGLLDGVTASTSYTFSGLTDNTTYTVYVIAKDAAGNTSTQSPDLNVTTLEDTGNGGGGCTDTTYDTAGFEGGFGSSIWNDGGQNARINANDNNFANTGSLCVRLRNGNTTSRITTDAMNLASYEEITVTFSYITTNLENGEGVSLQLSTNGSSYSTVDSWTRGSSFTNNSTRDSGSVTITGPFTSTTYLRFQNIANRNNERVYIDDVVISGCSNGSTSLVSNTNPITSINKPILPSIEDVKIYPNPTSNFITIKNLPQNCTMRLVSATTGRLLLETKAADKIDMSGYESGVYLLQIISMEGENKLMKIIKR